MGKIVGPIVVLPSGLFDLSEAARAVMFGEGSIGKEPGHEIRGKSPRRSRAGLLSPDLSITTRKHEELFEPLVAHADLGSQGSLARPVDL
jgi:hypothetical protein